MISDSARTVQLHPAFSGPVSGVVAVSRLNRPLRQSRRGCAVEQAMDLREGTGSERAVPARVDDREISLGLPVQPLWSVRSRSGIDGRLSVVGYIYLEYRKE